MSVGNIWQTNDVKSLAGKGEDFPDILLSPRLSEWAALSSVPFSKLQKGLFTLQRNEKFVFFRKILKLVAFLVVVSNLKLQIVIKETIQFLYF